MVPKVMTLNDLERRNSRFCVILPNSAPLGANYVIVVEVRSIQKLLTPSKEAKFRADDVKHTAYETFAILKLYLVAS